MGAPNPSSAAALPEELLAQILQLIPQQQRLQQCALTCKAWASAAALATAHVELKHEHGQSISAFDSWLQKYAEQLESLELSHCDCDTQLQLPLGKLARLQRLQLRGFKLLLPGEGDSSSSDGPGTQASAPLLLPSLQHLQLSKVQLVSSSSLLQLAGVPGLTSLKTKDISFAHFEPLIFCSGSSWGNDKTVMQQLAAALPSLLQKLPRLTVLELPGMPMSDAAMQQLGGMQGLQELTLARAEHMPACKLQHLPSSITQLHFSGDKHVAGIHGDPSMPPQLPQLAGLLQLDLLQCAFAPAVLGAFTRLQELKLRQCTLLPWFPDDDYATEGTATLLDALSKMTCLQELELSLEGLDTVSTAPQCFASLTASTQLTRLTVDPDDDIPLAKGAVRFMFPAGRQLPLLQHISITPNLEERQDWDADADEWCIDGTDISRIARCCSGLEWLDIALTVKPGADLSALLELPRSCTHVTVGGVAFTDAAASILVQLMQLEYLCLHNSPGFTDAGLEQLLDLDLASLDIFDCGLSHVDCEGYKALELRWCSQKGSVQEQLEELCDRSPVCAPARLRRQREANERLQSDNMQLRSDNTHARSDNTQLGADIMQLCLDKKQLRSDKEHLEAEVSALRMQLELSQAQVQRLQQQLKAAHSGDLQG